MPRPVIGTVKDAVLVVLLVILLVEEFKLTYVDWVNLLRSLFR